MILLIGLVAGVLIVIIVIAIGIIVLRALPQSQKSVKRGDGRYGFGPISYDNYGEPHIDSHGGPYD